MSQSLSKIIVHLVFSTKNRAPLIREAIQGELNAYIVGILRQYESPSIMTNSVDDHTHSLFVLSKNIALRHIVEEVKKGSSKWLKTKGPAFAGFYWQTGYGAFSVSEDAIDSVREYIANQREHHRHMTFQDELRALYQQHGIVYDERYLWD